MVSFKIKSIEIGINGIRTQWDWFDNPTLIYLTESNKEKNNEYEFVLYALLYNTFLIGKSLCTPLTILLFILLM